MDQSEFVAFVTRYAATSNIELAQRAQDAIRKEKEREISNNKKMLRYAKWCAILTAVAIIVSIAIYCVDKFGKPVELKPKVNSCSVKH